jgi:hypothetical protein
MQFAKIHIFCGLYEIFVCDLKKSAFRVKNVEKYCLRGFLTIFILKKKCIFAKLIFVVRF